MLCPFRQLGHANLRQLSAHLVALGRVVVQQHQGVHADIQGRRDGAQVACLVLPVGLKHRNVLLAQQHLRVLAKWLAGDGLIVFGRHGQHHAALSKGQRCGLH